MAPESLPTNPASEEFLAWLRELGVDPGTIPRDSVFTFRIAVGEPATLTFEAIVVGRDGRRVVQNNEFVRETRTIEVPRSALPIPGP